MSHTHTRSEGPPSFAILRPGDRVLMAFDGMLTLATADKIKEELEARFPGVEFALIDRTAAVLIQRGEP